MSRIARLRDGCSSRSSGCSRGWPIGRRRAITQAWFERDLTLAVATGRGGAPGRACWSTGTRGDRAGVEDALEHAGAAGTDHGRGRLRPAGARRSPRAHVYPAESQLACGGFWQPAVGAARAGGWAARRSTSPPGRCTSAPSTCRPPPLHGTVLVLHDLSYVARTTCPAPQPRARGLRGAGHRRLGIDRAGSQAVVARLDAPAPRDGGRRQGAAGVRAVAAGRAGPGPGTRHRGVGGAGRRSVDARTPQAHPDASTSTASAC